MCIRDSYHGDVSLLLKLNFSEYVVGYSFSGLMFLFVSLLRQSLSRQPYVSPWRGVRDRLCGNPRRSAIRPPVAWRIFFFLYGNPWRSEVRSYVSVRQLSASVFAPSPVRQPVAWRTLSYYAADRDF